MGSLLESWVKVNIDGAAYKVEGKAGVGGIIHKRDGSLQGIMGDVLQSNMNFRVFMMGSLLRGN